MGEITALTAVRQLWDYHWWPDRRSASPPDTGMVTCQLLQTGQRDMSRRWA